MRSAVLCTEGAAAAARWPPGTVGLAVGHVRAACLPVGMGGLIVWCSRHGPACYKQRGRAPQRAGDTDYVVQCVRTPTKEGSRVAADPIAALNAVGPDWMASHADQVQLALPGGLAVLGLAVACPTGARRTGCAGGSTAWALNERVRPRAFGSLTLDALTSKATAGNLRKVLAAVADAARGADPVVVHHCTATQR